VHHDHYPGSPDAKIHTFLPGIASEKVGEVRIDKGVANLGFRGIEEGEEARILQERG
jgi:hypothetical protein